MPSSSGDPRLQPTSSPGKWVDLKRRAKAPSSSPTTWETTSLKLTSPRWASSYPSQTYLHSLGITSVSVSLSKRSPREDKKSFRGL